MKTKRNSLLFFLSAALAVIAFIIDVKYGLGYLGGVMAIIIGCFFLLRLRNYQIDSSFRHQLRINRLLRLSIYAIFLIPACIYSQYYHYYGVLAGLLINKWISLIILSKYLVTKEE